MSQASPESSDPLPLLEHDRHLIDSFRQLMEATEPDFTPIYAELARLESIPAGSVLPSDKVYNCGTGEGWASDGDV